MYEAVRCRPAQTAACCTVWRSYNLTERAPSHARCGCAGRPEDSGIALQVIKEMGVELPVFGVCMGHQCIGQARPLFRPGLGLRALVPPVQTAQHGLVCCSSLALGRDNSLWKAAVGCWPSWNLGKCSRAARKLKINAPQVFGGRVVRAPCGVMHGKTSEIHHSGVGLMQARCMRAYSNLAKSH